MREVSVSEFAKAHVVCAAGNLAAETPTLGDRSYLVHDGRVAFVIDPQGDIDRVLDSAHAAGVRITHIFNATVAGRPITSAAAHEGNPR